MGGVAIRDTAVTARHSGDLAPARFSIELVSHTSGCKPPIVAAPAAARPESRPRSAESARVALTPRPSGGSLVPANHSSTQRLMAPSARSCPWAGRPIRTLVHVRGVRLFVVERRVASAVPGRNTTTPLRWQIEAGRCGGALSVAGVAVARCEEKSLCCCAKALAKCVSSNRSEWVGLSGLSRCAGRVAAGAVVRCAQVSFLVLVVVGARQRPPPPACWPGPTTATTCWPAPTTTDHRRPQDEQDRCHHRRRYHRARIQWIRAERSVGHFSQADPGQFSQASKDMGGHGYATVRLSGDEMRTEFVCIPRPVARSERPDGGPLRYRVAYGAKLWRPGERPQLTQQALEGDPGLGV